jgi:uncharacterized spore protein YtfJ
MDAIKKLADQASQRLIRLAQTSAVVTDPISVAGRHVLPLCELSIAFGSAGGTGEGESNESGGPNQGRGGGAAGGAKAVPIALLVIDENGARLETLNA